MFPSNTPFTANTTYVHAMHSGFGEPGFHTLRAAFLQQAQVFIGLKEHR
jgi:hypothetical protein